MTILAKLDELERKATPKEEWKTHAVTGDSARRLSPDSRQNLNSCAAWVVGPQTRSLLKANDDAAFIAAIRNHAADLIAVARAAKALSDDINLMYNIGPENMPVGTYITRNRDKHNDLYRALSRLEGEK
jgi:hypothetical protein